MNTMKEMKDMPWWVRIIKGDYFDYFLFNFLNWLEAGGKKGV